MPDATHSIHGTYGTDRGIDGESPASIDLPHLTAHLSALDLDPATLEILLAALTADVSDQVDVTSG